MTTNRTRGDGGQKPILAAFLRPLDVIQQPIIIFRFLGKIMFSQQILIIVGGRKLNVTSILFAFNYFILLLLFFPSSSS